VSGSISRAFQLNGAGALTTASYPFSNLTLLAWDYSISNREAALAQFAGITISFHVRRSSFRYTQQFTSRALFVRLILNHLSYSTVLSGGKRRHAKRRKSTKVAVDANMQKWR